MFHFVFTNTTCGAHSMEGYRVVLHSIIYWSGYWRSYGPILKPWSICGCLKATSTMPTTIYGWLERVLVIVSDDNELVQWRLWFLLLWPVTLYTYRKNIYGDGTAVVLLLSFWTLERSFKCLRESSWTEDNNFHAFPILEGFWGGGWNSSEKP